MPEVTVVADVAAPAELVYDLVADLPRMGEWSPECERVSWRGGVREPVLGAQFTGHNRNGWRRWSTHGTVTVADRGREFAFEVRSIFDLPVARWSYRFRADGKGGCQVTEATLDRRGPLMKAIGLLATGVGDRAARNRATMTLTLEQLRATAESASHVSTAPPV